MRILALLSLTIFAFVSTWEAHAKPFNKAMVIGGGGITPGIALGMIAGAKAAGYEPDVVITSCGSSLGAALYKAFPTPQLALKHAKSEKFYQKLKSMIRFNSAFAFGLATRLQSVHDNPDKVPFFFEGTVLNVPHEVRGLLPEDRFFSNKKTKLIIVAARAGFGPDKQGQDVDERPLFRETYITDPSTAKHLSGFASPIQHLFPYGRVDKKTEVLTHVPLSLAVRASITDPFYINPARIGNSYYWGGAVDLFPIETAQHLADEVLVNFPSGLYSGVEDLAVFGAYGFAQSDRTVEAAKHTDVKWMDGTGSAKLSFDPELVLGAFFDRMPATHERYALMIQRQFQFGYERAMEAVRLQKKHNNIRSHLRFTNVGVK